MRTLIQRVSTDLTNGGALGAEDKDPKFLITTPSSATSAGSLIRLFSASAGAEASVGQSKALLSPCSTML